MSAIEAIHSPSARAAGQSQLMVRELTPRVGESLPVGTISALIGAPNAGKSELLRDIVRLVAGWEPGQQDRDPRVMPEPTVLEDLNLAGRLNLDRLLDGLSRMPGGSNDVVEVQGFGPDFNTAYRARVGPELKNVLARPMLTARGLAGTPLGDFMPLRVAFLTVDDRLALVDSVAPANPLHVAESLLQALQDAPPGTQEMLDDAFQAAFPGHHIRLDDSQRVELALRIASAFPAEMEDAVAQAAFMNQFPRLESQGDAAKAFVAVVLSMLLSRGRIVLIDQPELYLPPATARCLGRWISEQTSHLQCQVFLLTNEVMLLQGLLEGPAEASVVRVQRDGQVTHMRSIPPEIGRSFARHPLFVSQRALQACFADAVVLAPSSEDALLYESVAIRHGRAGEARFLHAHGARHLCQMAHVLRQADLNFSVIAPLLEVFPSETQFTQLVEAVTGEPPPDPWLATRERFATCLDRTADQAALAASAHEVEDFLDQLKQGSAEALADTQDRPRGEPTGWSRAGETLELLPAEVRIWFEELLEDMKHKGIFIAQQGAALQWFPATELGGDRELWLPQAIKLLQQGKEPARLRAFVCELLEFGRALR